MSPHPHPIRGTYPRILIFKFRKVRGLDSHPHPSPCNIDDKYCTSSGIKFSWVLAGYWRQCELWVMRYAIVLRIVSIFLENSLIMLVVDQDYLLMLMNFRSYRPQIICHSCRSVQNSLYTCKSKGTRAGSP